MADPRLGHRADLTEVYAQLHNGQTFLGYAALLERSDKAAPHLELFRSVGQGAFAPADARGMFFANDGSALDHAIAPPPSYEKQPLQYRVALAAQAEPGRKRKADEELPGQPETKRNLIVTRTSHQFYRQLVNDGVFNKKQVHTLRASSYFNRPDLLATTTPFVRTTASYALEPPLQEHNTNQAAAVVGGIVTTHGVAPSRFWVDTHELGVLTGIADDPKWGSIPDGVMSSSRPSQLASAAQAEDAIAFVEYKAGSDPLTATGHYGQVSGPLVDVMEAQPYRPEAYALLANYAHVRLMRITRTVLSPYLEITFGPPESGDDYRLAFERFLLAPNASLGFWEPVVPPGYVRQASLGAGSSGRVLVCSRTAPADTAIVKCFSSLVSAARERANLLLFAALLPGVDDMSCARVPELHPEDFGPYCVAMRTRGSALTELTAAHARQVATLLDRIHASGRVHGDVRMPNILEDTVGRALLIDAENGLAMGENDPDIQRVSLSFQSDRVLRLIRDGATDIAYTAADERESFAKLLLDLRLDAVEDALHGARVTHRNRSRWATSVLHAWTFAAAATELATARALPSCVAIVDLLFDRH